MPGMKATFDLGTGQWVSDSRLLRQMLNSTIPFGGFSPSEGTIQEAALMLAQVAFPSLRVIQHTVAKDTRKVQPIF